MFLTVPQRKPWVVDLSKSWGADILGGGELGTDTCIGAKSLPLATGHRHMTSTLQDCNRANHHWPKVLLISIHGNEVKNIVLGTSVTIHMHLLSRFHLTMHFILQ